MAIFTTGLSEVRTQAGYDGSAWPFVRSHNHCTTTLVKVSWNRIMLELNDPEDRVYFWCTSALIIYKELSGSTGTEAWKYTERKKKRRVNFIPKFHSSLKKFVKYYTMITKRYMYGTKAPNFIGL